MDKQNPMNMVDFARTVCCGPKKSVAGLTSLAHTVLAESGVKMDESAELNRRASEMETIRRTAPIDQLAETVSMRMALSHSERSLIAEALRSRAVGCEPEVAGQLRYLAYRMIGCSPESAVQNARAEEK